MGLDVAALMAWVAPLAEGDLGAGEAIASALEGASISEIGQLAKHARSHLRFEGGRLDHPRTAMTATAILQLAPNHVTAVASLLSVHRNGYIRQGATSLLAAPASASGLPLATYVLPFLMLRTDDIIEDIRSTAASAVLHLVRQAGERSEAASGEVAQTLAGCLPVLATLRSRQRGAGGPLVRAIDCILMQHPDALAAATEGTDAMARREAYRLWVDAAAQPQPDGHTMSEVLRVALRDRDTGVRAWAARTAMGARIVDEDKRQVLPLLAAASSPAIRMIGLRVRARLDPNDPDLALGLVDPNASVRYTGRRLLHKHNPDTTKGLTRTRALAIVSEFEHAATGSSDPLIGALGALADVGKQADIEVVSKFASHPRARVRREANRTVTLLGWPPKSAP